MRSLLTTTTLLLGFGTGAALAQEQEYGTSEEARAMLERAVAAIQDDKAAALAAFNAGEADFMQKDLYVFCGNEAGEFTAHPTQMGGNMRAMQDEAGTPFGEQFYEVAREGEFQEVRYLWPRPGEEEPSQKSSFVTKVADQVCGVGYYQ